MGHGNPCRTSWFKFNPSISPSPWITPPPPHPPSFSFPSGLKITKLKINTIPPRDYNPPYGKRWRPYILSQYLANLTQPIGTLKVIFFYEILSCTNSIVYARFEVFKSFLCVSMSVFRVFARNELWVKLPVAIFFGTVDCSPPCKPAAKHSLGFPCYVGSIQFSFSAEKFFRQPKKVFPSVERQR